MRKRIKRGKGLRSSFSNNSLRASGLLGTDAASRGPMRGSGMRGKRRRGRGLRGGKWWESLLSGAAAIIPALL
jgi:hypothetical protein